MTAPCPSAHWWVLATPNGEWGLGVCKHCGEERDFRNGFATDYDEYNAQRKMLKATITPKADVSHVFARMASERQAQARGGKA